MRPNDDDLPNVDPGLLDRLVDGELSEAERRALLASLDRIPDGWRRCALAFLEAQCWREEFGAIRPPPAAPPVPAPRRAPARHATALAMAACLLLALGLGALLRDRFPSSGAEPADRATAMADASPGRSPPKPRRETVSPGKRSPAELDGGLWQAVALPVRGGRGSVRFPAREQAALNDAWLEHLPPAVPEELLDALKHSGHQVRLHRRLLPLPLKDGRRLVVPVDQVDVHYVGYPTYQ